MTLRSLLAIALVSFSLAPLGCGGETPPAASPTPGSNDPNLPPPNQSDFGGNAASDTAANPATPVGTAITSPGSPGGMGASPSGHFGGPKSETGVMSGGARAPTGAGGAGGSTGAAGHR